MAMVHYLFDDDSEVTADQPLDLTLYSTLDELTAARATAEDCRPEMRGRDCVFAIGLAIVAIGWLAAMTCVAWRLWRGAM